MDGWQGLAARGVMGKGHLRSIIAGTPQGGVISQFIANIFLHELDRVREQRCRHLEVLVRYADGEVILCRTEAATQEGLR